MAGLLRADGVNPLSEWATCAPFSFAFSSRRRAFLSCLASTSLLSQQPQSVRSLASRCVPRRWLKSLSTRPWLLERLSVVQDSPCARHSSITAWPAMLLFLRQSKYILEKSSKIGSSLRSFASSCFAACPSRNVEVAMETT